MPKKRQGIPENAKVKEGTEGKYKKYCPRCKKIFFSDSRNQKFCSDECRIAFSKKKKEQRQDYESKAPVYRLAARAHALAVSTYDLMVSLNLKEWKCDLCGETEISKLEIHHSNLNVLINTPGNLKCLCQKCHPKVHSDLQKTLDSKGVVVDEFYEESDKEYLPIARLLNKDKL